MKKKCITSLCPNLGRTRFFRVMKILSVLLLICSLSFATVLEGQKVNLSIEDGVVLDVLNEIESQCNLRFAYSPKFVDIDKKVNISVVQEEVVDVLDKVLSDTELSYNVEGDVVVLRPTSMFTSVQQNRQGIVSGKVMDTNGDAIPGATIVIKGTTNGIITNANGEYTIQNVPSDAIIQVSFIGMKTNEIAYDGSREINVTMKSELIGLEEVVAIGYGTVKKSDLTGAVSSLKAEDIVIAPSANIVESLQGVTPGVLITQNSGQPGGSGVNIDIRGTNSLTAGTNPLIVLDGLPLADGNLADINPNDILTMDVLKDASSTAIYGARGSNGVIIITTKTAGDSKGYIQYSPYVSIASPIKKLDLMNGQQVYDYRHEGQLAIGTENPTKEQILGNDPTMIDVYDRGAFINWQDEFFSQSVTQNHDLNFYHSGDKINNVFGVNYYDQEGMVENTGYKKYGIRNNFDYQAKEWLKIRANISLSNSNEDRDAGVINSVMRLTPIGEAIDDEGNYNKFINGEIENSNDRVVNPFLLATDKKQQVEKTRILANIGADIKLFKGLDYTLNLGVDKSFTEQRYWASSLVDPNGTRSFSDIKNWNRSSINMDHMLNYALSINEVHNLKATAVFNRYEYLQNYNEMSNANLPNDILDWDQIGGGDEPGVKRGVNEWKLESYMARVHYDYRNKYLLTVTYRRDGSSRFGPNNKYADFPSAAVAWKVNEEQFMNSIKVISQLKLRASYGKSGNQNIDLFAYESNAQSGFYNYYGADFFQYYYNPDGKGDSRSPGNPDLKWEETSSLNLGVDFGLWNNRLTGSFEYYDSHTSDLLMTRAIPRTNGAYKSWDNVGAVDNTGIELGISGTIVSTRDFRWKAMINYTQNKNTLVELSNLDEDGNPANDYTWGRIIGEPLNSIYDFKAVGFFKDQAEIDNYVGPEGLPIQPNAQPGDIKFADLDGDGAITDNGDRTILGNNQPDWYGSLSNSFSYKGWSFSFMFTTKQGVERVNQWISKADFRGQESLPNLAYWTADNPEGAVLPRPNANDAALSRERMSAIAVQDASYIALQNVSLNYNLPSKWLKSLPIESVRCFANGNNLKYWSDFYGYTPENGDKFAYPVFKSYTFGLDIKF